MMAMDLKFISIMLIGLVLLSGCSGKFYERTSMKVDADGILSYEHVKVELDSSLTNTEANDIVVSTLTEPNGNVTRTLSTGGVKQDISEEALKTITESVVKTVITAITHIPK